MKWDELQDRIRIDRNALDNEVSEQPELLFHAGRQYAASVGRRDAAKDRLKQTDAELHFKVRADLAKTTEKVTESTVAARIESHPDHLEARDALTAAQKEMELWLALKEAFSERGWMLRELCGLFTVGYFSSASVSGGAPREVERAAHESTKTEMHRRRQGAT